VHGEMDITFPCRINKLGDGRIARKFPSYELDLTTPPQGFVFAQIRFKEIARRRSSVIREMH